MFPTVPKQNRPAGMNPVRASVAIFEVVTEPANAVVYYSAPAISENTGGQEIIYDEIGNYGVV